MTSKTVGANPTNYLIFFLLYKPLLNKKKLELQNIKKNYNSSLLDIFYKNYTNFNIKNINIICIKIKFKYNYRYTVSLLYNYTKQITLSSRCNNKKNIIKKNRYLTILIFLLKCINKLTKTITNTILYFFFKNTNMKTLSYLKYLLKLVKLTDTKILVGFIYNINGVVIPSKNFKKIRTIKKFKKKIFLKQARGNLKEFFK